MAHNNSQDLAYARVFEVPELARLVFGHFVDDLGVDPADQWQNSRHLLQAGRTCRVFYRHAFPVLWQTPSKVQLQFLSIELYVKIRNLVQRVDCDLGGLRHCEHVQTPIFPNLKMLVGDCEWSRQEANLLSWSYLLPSYVTPRLEVLVLTGQYVYPATFRLLWSARVANEMKHAVLKFLDATWESLEMYGVMASRNSMLLLSPIIMTKLADLPNLKVLDTGPESVSFLHYPDPDHTILTMPFAALRILRVTIEGKPLARILPHLGQLENITANLADTTANPAIRYLSSAGACPNLRKLQLLDFEESLEEGGNGLKILAETHPKLRSLRLEVTSWRTTLIRVPEHLDAIIRALPDLETLNFVCKVGSALWFQKHHLTLLAQHCRRLRYLRIQDYSDHYGGDLPALDSSLLPRYKTRFSCESSAPSYSGPHGLSGLIPVTAILAILLDMVIQTKVTVMFVLIVRKRAKPSTT
ncbi:hypothetical protein G7K_1897-t1 [Saitoella complicata NRRL Y-17804]|uniref:F-box domain-containing protein n=1 Tax=Saitoella complicata (strain BCRC 22490 / CBS 7301 / JCM 7358 / NBRC 10748 / NRRL Y-17804) TaxID=698492 RepID=A0A0E9ND19_SAICN|nr:hypothetical protein G7K_1897-t1 [Saitoella complicata NRRL Y-17804]